MYLSHSHLVSPSDTPFLLGREAMDRTLLDREVLGQEHNHRCFLESMVEEREYASA